MGVSSNRREWLLVLGEGNLNRDAVRDCEQALRKALGDPTIRIRRSEAGSAYIVESSRASFVKMQGIMEEGKDVELSGIVIREVLGSLSSAELVEEIPPEEYFEASARPLPPRLSLGADLPVEVPSIEDAHMSAIFREQMRQARLSFNCALPLGAIGILVAFWGAASWPMGWGKGAAGIDVGIGGIMEVLTFVLLRFHSEMNRRLDEAQKEVRAQRREDRLFLKLLKIEDPVKRDEAITRFVGAALTRPVGTEGDSGNRSDEASSATSR